MLRTLFLATLFATLAFYSYDAGAAEAEGPREAQEVEVDGKTVECHTEVIGTETITTCY